MNKIAKTLCMIAVVALAFTSCKKEENQAESFAFNGTAEQFMEVNEDGEFERMYIDDTYKTFYEVNDQFMMYCVYDAPYISMSNSTLFYLDADGILKKVVPTSQISTEMEYPGNYYSFYPGQAVTEVWYEDGHFMSKFVLPNTLEYRTHESGYVQMPWEAVMMAAKDERSTKLRDCAFHYRNIMGAMSLRLYSAEGQTVKAIRVKDNRFNLAGTVNMNIAEADPNTLQYMLRNYDETNTSYMLELQDYIGPDHLNVTYEGDLRHSITLDCGAGVELGATAAEATRFLIPLRPLALMNGCEVTVVFTDGTTKVFNTTTDHRMMPNVIMNFYPMSVD
jgi:hypothetical protein